MNLPAFQVNKIVAQNKKGTLIQIGFDYSIMLTTYFQGKDKYNHK